MLVICNGAFKSGSTWIFELTDSILRAKGVSLQEVPKIYSPNRSPAMKIAENQLPNFIAEQDLARNWYLTKAHFFKRDTLARQYGQFTKFLFVERDIRDAIVSHYHHFLVYNRVSIKFPTYYKLVGRYKAHEIYLFNKVCEEYFDRSLFFRFEEMKTDLKSTIDRIANLLELQPLSMVEIERVISETTLDSMREKALKGDKTHYHNAGVNNAKLFRAGRTGEYLNYFDDSSLKDIENIIQGNSSGFFKLTYDILFTWRRRIF